MRWYWIDRFIEFESGKSAKSVKAVTLAEDHLHDHWDAFPIMPCSLMVEGMAQTAGILVGQARDFKEKVILAKVSRAQFDDIVTPGDQLEYHAEIENITPDAAVTKGAVMRDGTQIGTVNLMFSHIDQNLAGQEFPEENFVFTGQFERLVAPFLENDDA